MEVIQQKKSIKDIIKALEICYKYFNIDGENIFVPQQFVLDVIALLKAWEEGEMEMTEREKVINNLKYQIHLLYDIIPHVSHNDGEYLEAVIKTMSNAFALLKAQEPHKKGYWIYPLSTDCVCSECGNQPEHEPGESIPLYDYCPYCGAKMRKE